MRQIAPTETSAPVAAHYAVYRAVVVPHALCQSLCLVLRAMHHRVPFHSAPALFQRSYPLTVFPSPSTRPTPSPRYDAAYFAWEKRRERLWDAVSTHRVGCRMREPDLITLAECDCYAGFWRERLRERGYDSIWRKRPRDCSPDGCCIGWRSSTFELVATAGYDFGTQLNKPPDRVCLFALLKWRRDPTVQLVVATTHLQRDPESETHQLARGFQYGSIFRKLLSFASAHGAEDAPVVFTGDLNSKDCDELAGIARALVRLLSSPTHPLLWSVTDAPTPATTVTEERQLRIDYVLYQSDSLALTGAHFFRKSEKELRKS